MLMLAVITASCLELLRSIDERIAREIQRRGCPYCQGRLDAGHYQRNLSVCSACLEKRWSWCCRDRGCRRRVTPPSVLFWGRLQYAGALVLTMLAEDHKSKAGREMQRQIGCSGATWQRWRERWRGLLESGAGRLLSGMMPAAALLWGQVSSVLSLWSGSRLYQMAMLLLALHPTTGGTGWASEGLRAGSLDPQKLGFASQLEALKEMPRGD